MHFLPIKAQDHSPTHLAVRFDEPAESPDAQSSGNLVILYIHGFGSRQSGTKAEYFRRRFGECGVPFCSFDFRGHGDSGGTMHGLSLSRNLEDLTAIRRFLGEQGYERIVLMGSSMGGGSALWSAALDHKGIVAGVHIAPSLAMHEGVLSRISAEDAEKWEREGVLEFQNDLGTWEIAWGLIEDLRSYSLEDLYADHRVPTLIFQGKKDDTVPWERAVDFAVQHIREQVELVLMSDADHRMIDRMDYLWHLTTGFLCQKGFLDRKGCLSSDLASQENAERGASDGDPKT